VRRIHLVALCALLLHGFGLAAHGQEKFPVFQPDNLGRCGAMHVLTAQEAFAHQQQICDQIGQWEIYGLADGGAMGGPGYRCSIHRKWPAEMKLAKVLCVAGTPPNLAGKDLVTRFAPELKFDRAAQGYPMSPQPFFDKLPKDGDGNPVNQPGDAQVGVENTNRATLKNGSIPTYYQIRTVGNQVRIRYWWFYGYQDPCFMGKGKHNGDWENVIVILREDRNAVAAVSYFQHGGWYTRISGSHDAPCTPAGTGRCGGSSGFRSDGEHPVVYVGKVSHGSFHDDNSAGPGGAGQCAYWGDFRNPASEADILRTWSSPVRLVDLDSFEEPWMSKDNWVQHSSPNLQYPQGEPAAWFWGPDGVSRHPTQDPPPLSMAACKGTPTYTIGEPDPDGCYKSECLAGDDQASQNCLKECKPGYTNTGLVCQGSFGHMYGRLQGDHWYKYDYTIPSGDAGLSRLRHAIGDSNQEWDLP
jgi:hypothetical protein